jgi:hypothetical protein
MDYMLAEIAPAGNIRRGVKVGREQHVNAEPVDPAIRTTQLPRSIVECGLSIGT